MRSYAAGASSRAAGEFSALRRPAPRSTSIASHPPTGRNWRRPARSPSASRLRRASRQDFRARQRQNRRSAGGAERHLPRSLRRAGDAGGHRDQPAGRDLVRPIHGRTRHRRTNDPDRRERPVLLSWARTGNMPTPSPRSNWFNASGRSDYLQSRSRPCLSSTPRMRPTFRNARWSFSRTRAISIPLEPWQLRLLVGSDAISPPSFASFDLPYHLPESLRHQSRRSAGRQSPARDRKCRRGTRVAKQKPLRRVCPGRRSGRRTG